MTINEKFEKLKHKESERDLNINNIAVEIFNALRKIDYDSDYVKCELEKRKNYRNVLILTVNEYESRKDKSCKDIIEVMVDRYMDKKGHLKDHDGLLDRNIAMGRLRDYGISVDVISAEHNSQDYLFYFTPIGLDNLSRENDITTLLDLDNDTDEVSQNVWKDLHFKR